MSDASLSAFFFAILFASSCSSAPAPSPPSGPDAPLVRRRTAAEFMTGDECLFCHRNTIGAGWGRNLHNLTLHAAGAVAGETAAAGAEFALGAREAKHWLRTTADYGVLAMRSAGGSWDEGAFGASCAGCHASGVDPETGAFAALSLDCFVCHGDVTLDHTKVPKQVHLSPRGDLDAVLVVSTCGQCHLRGGRSRSTGRPWPRRFIAGASLLEDFEFDFSANALAALSVADRHVAENVRDVSLRGQAQVTCLSCHSIHGESNRAHRQVEETELCFTCHVRGDRLSRRHAFTRSSPVCRISGGT